MSERQLTVESLTADAFAPFGDVIEAGTRPHRWINAGRCARYHDLAHLDFVDGRAGISLFDSEPVSFPYRFDLMERHPLGSQAFLPLCRQPFLVVVALDDGGRPMAPRVFLTDGRQGVNYHRNTWHGVLAPLGDAALFAVIDRIGDGENLEEYRCAEPWSVVDA